MRISDRMGACRRGLAAVAAALCLAACGYFGGGSGAAGSAQVQHAAAAPAAAPAADPLARDLVEAVSASRNSGPVDLRFALQQRPVAGQPLTVKLRLSMGSSLDRVEAHFRADDGLDIRDGAQLAPVDHPAAGANVEHDLTVIPEHEGVYTLMATITTTSQSESVSRSFSIPILVDPAPPSAPGSAAPPVAATAQH
ncbi:MAG TPA: hypothetical protein VMB48_08270 [Steroidobacteraceae bacterium]|nr:hypothetical protein [Steroidobacteraceae bacterium]